MLGDFLFGSVVGASLSGEQQKQKVTYIEDLKDTLSKTDWTLNDCRKNIIYHKKNIKVWNKDIRKSKDKLKSIENKFRRKLIVRTLNKQKEHLEQNKKWVSHYEEEYINYKKRDIDLQVAFFLSAGYNYYTNGNVTPDMVKKFKKNRGIK